MSETKRDKAETVSKRFLPCLMGEVRWSWLSFTDEVECFANVFLVHGYIGYGLADV